MVFARHLSNRLKTHASIFARGRTVYASATISTSIDAPRDAGAETADGDALDGRARWRCDCASRRASRGGDASGVDGGKRWF